MTLITLLEHTFFGKRRIKERDERDAEISQLKEQIEQNNQKMQGEIRQHAQVVESGSRIMETMTAAMAMMETGRERN